MRGNCKLCERGPISSRWPPYTCVSNSRFATRSPHPPLLTQVGDEGGRTHEGKKPYKGNFSQPLQYSSFFHPLLIVFWHSVLLARRYSRSGQEELRGRTNQPSQEKERILAFLSAATYSEEAFLEYIEYGTCTVVLHSE